jgi:hypothetical protein
MFTVSNTRVPVSSVEVLDGGAWSRLRRQFPDNHFAANGGPFTFPMQVERLASCLVGVMGEWVHSCNEDPVNGCQIGTK